MRGGGYVGTTLRGIGAYRAAKDAYLIWPGASNPTAVLGYVDAMLEVGEQVAQGLAPKPDLIVLPTGSGGTLAGLAIGCAILGWDTLPIGVRITDLFACNRFTVRFLVTATLRFLKKLAPGLEVPRPRFALHHGAIGKGYGEPTDDAIAAMPEIEKLLGVPGEVTYSGKALAGLRTIARENKDKTILFWATLSSNKPDVASLATLPKGFEEIFEGELSL